MTPYFCSLRRLLPCALVTVVGLLVAPRRAPAQVRWTVDTRSSLAWWQVVPDLNHLWATTCPSDPDWRPGEGRSAGWEINKALKLPKHGFANVEDTVHVPLYPRKTVQPICAEAVRGDVEVADTAHWRGVHGIITVDSDALITGEHMRDVMMHQSLESAQYPELQFTVDSLEGVTRDGDTLRGSVVGSFRLRSVNRPTVASLVAFPVGNELRVLVKWRIPAGDLAQLTPLIHYMGLGVNTDIWKLLYMGADIVLRPEAAR